MFIIKNRNIFFGFVGLISALALGAIVFFGINKGIDFTGGNLAEIRFEGPLPQQEVLLADLEKAGVMGASLRPAGDSGYILRADSMSAELQARLVSIASREGSTARLERMTDIGPTIGVELYRKSIIAMLLVVLAILIYLAFAFKTPAQDPKLVEKNIGGLKDVSSWWYGLIAIFTLMHDILVPLGLVAVLGHYAGAQVDTLFITALLTILGYSVNDTIVIFDRVREKVRAQIGKKGTETDFTTLVGTALQETYGRSINTSLTVLISLVALYIFGPDATKFFALTLIAGVVAGTYSSIMLATPLLVEVHKRTRA